MHGKPATKAQNMGLIFFQNVVGTIQGDPRAQDRVIAPHQRFPTANAFIGTIRILATADWMKTKAHGCVAE